LEIHAQQEEAFSSRLGAHLIHECQLGRAILRPQVRAEWKHEFSDDALALDSSFAGVSNSAFTVHGPRRGSDSAVVSAGVTAEWSPRLLTFINYYGEAGRENYTQHSVTAGFRVSF
jgi:outer membrane autotransporter protein